MENHPMTSFIIPSLIAPDAPWRARSSVSLAEAWHVAAGYGVSAHVLSAEHRRSLPITLDIHAAAAPTFAVARAEGDASAVRAGASREIDDGVFEISVSISVPDVVFFLRLTSGEQHIDLPLMTGDRAAVIEHGFADASVGMLSEVRVKGEALANALNALVGGDAVP